MNKRVVLKWVGRDGIMLSAEVDEVSLPYFIFQITSNGGRIVHRVTLLNTK